MHVDFHRVVQFVRGLWKNQEKNFLELAGKII